MTRLEARSIADPTKAFDVGELFEAVRAAPTPEEQAIANEAISAVAATLRSKRLATRGTAVREGASKARRASVRLGAAILVSALTASTSLAISGQLPPDARRAAASFLANIGLLVPAPRFEPSGQATAPHTTGEPFEPKNEIGDRLLSMPGQLMLGWVRGSQSTAEEPDVHEQDEVGPPPDTGPPPQAGPTDQVPPR